MEEVEPSVKAAMASQGKAILQASLVSQRAEDTPPPGGGADGQKALAVKALRMKEDITREASSRAAAMRDREERAVLASVLAAVRRGDADKAAKVLEQRLAKVDRRVALRGDDSSGDDEGDDEGGTRTPPPGASGGGGEEEGAGGGASSQAREAKALAARMTKEQWVQASGGVLGVGGLRRGGGDLGGGGDADMAGAREHLDRTGFFLGAPPPPSGGAGELAGQILAGMEGLRRAGIPPFYVWMYDEPWELMLEMWRRAEAVMGCECLLEPTVAAYHLSHQAAQRGGNAYIGTNFALPHRDYTYGDTYAADGTPQLLTVWVPVCHVSVDNGCMYVVPREFDAGYGRDDAPEHMLVQRTGWLAGKSYLSFPLAGARPLAPAAAGTMMAWWGNVIHWGGQCHEASAGSPRASVACVFRRVDAPADPDTPPLTREGAEGLTAEGRRRLVEASIEFFAHWSRPWGGV